MPEGSNALEAVTAISGGATGRPGTARAFARRFARVIDGDRMDAPPPVPVTTGTGDALVARMANIVFVLGDDFEDSEFRVPYDGLKAKGHTIDIIGAKAGATVKGKKGKEEVTIAKAASEVDAGSYDALVIPGGYSPDHLRMDEATVALTQQMLREGKVVAAVCHGPQLLIEAEGVKGRVVTSWPSVRKDLENAGATWVDEEVHVDGKLITSRKPDDLPAFTAAIVKQLG